MKAIAIIEIPEGGKGKWYIDGEIRYTENESLMKKFDADMVPLKPLPQEREFGKRNILPIKVDGNSFVLGWNACLNEITGETE